MSENIEKLLIDLHKQLDEAISNADLHFRCGRDYEKKAANLKEMIAELTILRNSQ